jgi:hypothetical protein
MSAEVSFTFHSTFCSTADATVYNLPGYVDPQIATVNIWQGVINWIKVNDKYFDAPFNFKISDNSISEVLKLWKKHQNDCQQSH